jgi:hypothetical protein
MSKEKTADFFKDKSEEEIMNWMVSNMTSEQIKSCFEGDMPEEPDIIAPQAPQFEAPFEGDINDLRKYCANKRYVIHKIEGNNVFFWYYLVKKKEWDYSIEPLKNFPQFLGQNADECGEDTNIEPDFASELKNAYINSKFNPSERFIPYNIGLDQIQVFDRVKDQYKTENINTDWDQQVNPDMDVLIQALNYQKNIPILNSSKEVIQFPPVLIEGVNGQRVYYYYLMLNQSNNLEFIYANLPINKIKKDFEEIATDLELEITPKTPNPPPTSKTIPEWQEEIRNALNNIDSDDLQTIKLIYQENPLSTQQACFMKNLFPQMNFGNSCSGKIDKSEYINKFGSYIKEHYKMHYIKNKYGNEVVTIVPK